MDLFDFLPLRWFGLGLVSLAIQVFFAVHAIRTGRGWWVLILFFFPVAGSLVYLLAEFLPWLRARRIGGEPLARSLARKLNPAAEVRRLEDQLAHSNSVTNRIELARAYAGTGRKEEAIALYRSCMEGVHGDDPRVLSELGKALYEGGYHADALGVLGRLRQQRALSKEEQLVQARALEDSGDTEGALREYAPLARHSAGEEARLRYALLLRKLGRDTEAKAVFEEILRHARMSPGFYRREQKAWIAQAKKELKDLGSRAGSAK